MSVRKSPTAIFFTLFVLNSWAASGVKEKPAVSEGISTPSSAVMWREPADIRSRNLFYGAGGKQHVPQGPYTFVKEDPDGTTPKFVVTDGKGNRWKVKLGVEARPETVATRFVWAVGYTTDEDYFVSDMQVGGMPARLHRGQNLIGPNGSVHNARLEREGVRGKKVGTWHWRNDAFTGTRELNGLRVVMALINNWDLKDVNTAIREEGNRRVYLVADLGASFGSAGRSWPGDKAKGNLEAYRQSKFIREATATTVDFQTPARPALIYIFGLKAFWSRVRMEQIGRHVPREDVRWMGGWLARLSPKQIRDAFAAAAYPPQEVDGFAAVMERRIAMLMDP